MKKQTKFKTYLLSSIIILFLIIINTKSTINPNQLLAYSFIADQDTSKNQYNQQIQKIEKINQQIDSVKLKWDTIEKAIKEKQKSK